MSQEPAATGVVMQRRFAASVPAEGARYFRKNPRWAREATEERRGKFDTSVIALACSKRLGLRVGAQRGADAGGAHEPLPLSALHRAKPLRSEPRTQARACAVGPIVRPSRTTVSPLAPLSVGWLSERFLAKCGTFRNLWTDMGPTRSQRRRPDDPAEGGRPHDEVASRVSSLADA